VCSSDLDARADRARVGQARPQAQAEMARPCAALSEDDPGRAAAGPRADGGVGSALAPAARSRARAIQDHQAAAPRAEAGRPAEMGEIPKPAAGAASGPRDEGG